MEKGTITDLYNIISEDLGSTFLSKFEDQDKLDQCLINAMEKNTNRSIKHFSDTEFMGDKELFKYVLEEADYANDFIKEILFLNLYSNNEKILFIKTIFEMKFEVDYLCFQDLIKFSIENNFFKVGYLSHIFYNDIKNNISSYLFNLEYILNSEEFTNNLKLFFFYKLFTTNLDFSTRYISEFYKSSINLFKLNRSIKLSEKIFFLNFLISKKQKEVDNYILSLLNKNDKNPEENNKIMFLRDNYLSKSRLNHLNKLLNELG